MNKLYITNFDLKTTIESGQLFRYWKANDSYFVCMRSTLFQFRQEGDCLLWDAVSLDGSRVHESAVVHLFRLDEDYYDILESIKVDEHMIKIVEKYNGLRQIRQDSWECLISFLASMASNIPKHTAFLNKICGKYGKSISLNGFSTFTFPNPGELPDEVGLRKLGAGFRTKYIHFANISVNDVNLAGFVNLNYGDAKAALMKFPGVADKVANCVMLFSLDFLESFPVDVWIKRVVEELYFVENIKAVEEFGRDYFGCNAGYAQQFLYHWRRLMVQKSL